LTPFATTRWATNEINRQEEDQAAKYIDKAVPPTRDSVRVSNHAYWRVQYYLRRARLRRRAQIADEGGEVYSSVVWRPRRHFWKGRAITNGALVWYAKIEERYDNDRPLLAFCERYKQRTGDTRFDAEVKKRLKKVFPNGIEKVSLAGLPRRSH